MITRMMVRHAAIMALANGFEAPFPTMAGALVWDTKLDSIETLVSETLVPSVLVYTDQDHRTLLDRAAGIGAMSRRIQLVIEIAVGSFKREDGAAQPAYVHLETDAEIEAMLDIFEWQVEAALTSPLGRWSALFMGMVKRLDEWSSEPARQADRGNRVSMRQIALTLEVAGDCRPGIAPEGTVIAEPPGDPPPLFLPPYLAPFEAQIAQEAGLADLYRELRAQQAGLPTRFLPLLRTTRFRTDVLDPVVDPNRLPEGQRRGPDGRIEYEFEAKGN